MARKRVRHRGASMLREQFRCGATVRLLTLACCAALIGGEASGAKLVAPRNPFEGVLGAELVVIVKDARSGACSKSFGAPVIIC
jgi:hypothetical protein